MRSKKQAAIKTPPEKQEQRLMKISHLRLEPLCVLSRSFDRNLKGIIPPRNVTQAITSIVAIFSLSSLLDVFMSGFDSMLVLSSELALCQV